MNKKVYRIRDKKTGEFISLGYRHKTSWLVKPNAAIKESPELFKDDPERYEFVIFELKEVFVEPIIL